MVKKTIVIAVCFILTVMSVMPMAAAGSNKEDFKRVINVVYDDSGSMMVSDDNKDGVVDKWCNAQYSMEVFAAMLGNCDTVNVYKMSSYNNPFLIKGKDDPADNVKKVRNKLTGCTYTTPFAAVKKAYNDLKKTKADDKCLVVLTDGAFEDASAKAVNKFFSNKSKNIKVAFLSIGEDATAISEDTDDEIYAFKADNSKEIFENVTRISNVVLNSNEIKLSDSKGKYFFDIDIPMQELVVFAQGKDAEIKNIIDKNKEKTSPEKTVKVKPSDKASKKFSGKLDKSLVGCVAIYKDQSKGYFDAGKYELDVKGTSDIKVYYKPYVDIAVYLVNDKTEKAVRLADSKDKTESADLKAGTYTLKFGFVNKGTKEKVNKSKLLGNIEYSADISNNGEKGTYKEGDKVTLADGKLHINAEAKYLKYNTVSTSLDYHIYKDRTVEFTKESDPQYIIKSNGIENNEEPVKIKMTMDGQEFTDEQWDEFDAKDISVENCEEHDFEACEYKVTKESEKGCISITPVLKNNKPSKGTYEDCKVNVKYLQKVGKEKWTGSSKINVKYEDKRSWLERNSDKLIKWLIIGLLIFLILGYIPPFKKYLPKRLKKSPAIEGEPRRIGIRPSSERGSYFKDIASTLVPYKAETGSVRFAPRGIHGVPSLKVKACGGGKMEIVNTSAFAGQESILFDGVSVPENVTKNLKKGAGMTVSVETAEMDYICKLNK